MTWSIVALDADGSFGVAVASRFFAVGALCPYASSGVGAVATQALVNPLYASPALEALARGDDPAHVVQSLTAADSGRDERPGLANRQPDRLVGCVDSSDVTRPGGSSRW